MVIDLGIVDGPIGRRLEASIGRLHTRAVFGTRPRGTAVGQGAVVTGGSPPARADSGGGGYGQAPGNGDGLRATIRESIDHLVRTN